LPLPGPTTEWSLEKLEKASALQQEVYKGLFLEPFVSVKK
jgi:hypothetical protein